MTLPNRSSPVSLAEFSRLLTYYYYIATIPNLCQINISHIFSWMCHYSDHVVAPTAGPLRPVDG